MRPRLATELKVTVDELDDLLTQESEPGGPAAEARQRALDPAQTDLTTVAELRSEFEELAARYDRTPSASLLAKGGEQLSLITFMARKTARGRTERELLSLQGDAFTLMGQLVWDASQRRDHATARSYYDQSVTVARRLRDHALEGHALLRTCYVALYGAQDPQTGLDLALQAAATARSISPALTGMALLHAGEAHAMLGEAQDCERALDAAQRHLERSDGVDAAADLVSPPSSAASPDRATSPSGSTDAPSNSWRQRPRNCKIGESLARSCWATLRSPISANARSTPP